MGVFQNNLTRSDGVIFEKRDMLEIRYHDRTGRRRKLALQGEGMDLGTRS